jgi:hypothetical protein
MRWMPWKESSVMDERMRFVIGLQDGESMASLCREFGISRKTGYKIFERYEQCGPDGLSDRTRRPCLRTLSGGLPLPGRRGLAQSIHRKSIQLWSPKPIPLFMLEQTHRSSERCSESPRAGTQDLGKSALQSVTFFG